VSGGGRVGRGLPGGRKQHHAELRRRAQMHLRTPGPRQELRAQADAEHRLRGGGKGAGKLEQCREVAAARVVVGVHDASQDQQAVMLGGVRRQLDASLRSQRGHARRPCRHPLADQPGGRGRVVLEHQDPRPHVTLVHQAHWLRRRDYRRAHSDASVPAARRRFGPRYSALRKWTRSRRSRAVSPIANLLS
jgi:hypothetical protein